MRTLLALTAIVAAVVLSTREASAQGTHVTKDGYVACLTLEEFNAQLKLATSGDRTAWATYMQTHNCVVLKAGVRVYIGGAKGIGIIRIRPAGQTIWLYTFTEAVRKT